MLNDRGLATIESAVRSEIDAMVAEGLLVVPGPEVAVEMVGDLLGGSRGRLA